MSGSRWLRLYTEIYRDPKVSKLSDRLFRFWIGCLCLAAEHDGIIPIHTDVAYYLRLPSNKVLENLLELKKHGLLDDSANKRFMPHNWHGRQYESDSSTERVRRFRERSKGNDMKRFSNGTEQTQKQIQNRTDTEQSADARAFAEQFPEQSNQIATVREYLSLVEPSEKEAVFACLERYKASDVVARGILQSGANWLKAQKDNGWSGQWPAPRKPPNSRTSWDEILEEMKAEDEQRIAK